MIECNIHHKKDKMWVCLPHAKEIMEDKPYYYIQKAHDPALLERPDVKRRMMVVSHDEEDWQDEDPNECPICEKNEIKVSINQPGGAPDLRVCVPCAKDYIVNGSDYCYITEIHDLSLADDEDIIKYMKENFLVAETEDDKPEPKPKPKPKPVITYEIHGDTKIMVETYPDGLAYRKDAGTASKNEKVVILAQETYDKVLNITDHKTACDMMAHIFTTLLRSPCEHSY